MRKRAKCTSFIYSEVVQSGSWEYTLKQIETRKQKLRAGFQVKGLGDTVLHGCAGSACGESQGAWRSFHGMT